MCVHVCVSAIAVLDIRNYVSYTSHKRSVLIVKLLIIIHDWTCSFCVLFVLYDWNITKTNTSARFYVAGK